MKDTDFREIGARLKAAFRLSTRPLAVYGSEILPASIPPMTKVNRCFAVSMYWMATGNEVSATYVSANTSKGCCLGGLYHVGYIPVPDVIKYFVSTGRKNVHGGVAEYMKANPKLVERCMLAAGPIYPPGKYLVVQACETLQDSGPSIRSLCCFDTAKQMRNMAALIHFDRDDSFSPVIVPWGSACSTYITFPVGLAAKTPRDTAFIGPQDPTPNHPLPPEMIAIGIPANIAGRMMKNLDASFIIRRPHVAFPNREKKLSR